LFHYKHKIRLNHVVSELNPIGMASSAYSHSNLFQPWFMVSWEIFVNT